MNNAFLLKIAFVLTLISSSACAANSYKSDYYTESTLFDSWQIDHELTTEYYSTFNSPVERLNNKDSYCYFVSAKMYKDTETGDYLSLPRQFLDGDFDVYFYLNNENKNCTDFAGNGDYFYIDSDSESNSKYDLFALKSAKFLSQRLWIDDAKYVITYFDEKTKECVLSNQQEFLSIMNVSDIEDVLGYSVNAGCTLDGDSYDLIVEFLLPNVSKKKINFTGIEKSK